MLLAIAGGACTGNVGETPTGGGSSAGGGSASGGGTNAGGGGDALGGGSATGGGAGGGGAVPTRLYSTHLMIAFVGHADNLQAWIQSLKDAGYNHLWAHMDDYGGYYVPGLQRVLDAAQAVGGITVSPGTAGGMTPEKVKQVVLDSYHHPALLKLGGKRVYADYGHDTAQSNAAVALLAAEGIERSTYLLLANTLYPIQNGASWLEHASGTPADVNAVNHAYDLDPNLDGVINFAVDKGTSDATTAISRIINENTVTTQASAARGKLTMAGVNAFYASVQFTDLGFAGPAAIWQSLLDSAIRPEFVNDTTANDYTELSYMAPLENSAPDGLAYVPLVDAGYVLGPTVRTPLLDHSGVQRFLRPWSDAYRSGAAQPVFTADRMFAWYSLHPAGAPLIATLPGPVAALSGPFTQTWWSGTVYATGNSAVGGLNQVDGIRTRLGPQLGTIRMAAHLTAPAQLKINDTLSAVMPQGAAYFEIPQALGLPTFSIVRNGVTVRSGVGRQPITDSVWPGAWNCLATEIP